MLENMQINLRQPLLIYGIPLGIFTASIFFASGLWFKTDADLYTGITYDLTLTAPIVYFFLIRKTQIPKITILPVFVAGVVIASFVIPEHNQYHLKLVKNYLLPLVELSALATIVYYAIQTTKQLKKQQKSETDTYSIIQKNATDIVGKSALAKVLATELGMVYYTFFAWKKPTKTQNQFTIHKESGIIATMGALIFLILVETVVLHLLLVKWNALFAWVIFGLSCYTALQIFGHTNALTKRFITLSANQLYLKYGLFGDTVIDYTQIEKVEISSKEVPEDALGIQKMALVAITSSSI